MVGSEERFWLRNAFCMSHTWILDPGHHFFFCVWIFVFIVNGARTTSILEDRRGVGFFGWICFQPQFQPKFSGGISSSIAHRQFRSPPSELAPSALAALVASSLHRARRPRADRADASSSPPSSRSLRSPPSSRPRSIARAATFVPRAPIALTPPSAHRARVLCARRPRRVLSPSRSPPLSFPSRRSRQCLRMIPPPAYQSRVSSALVALAVPLSPSRAPPLSFPAARALIAPTTAKRASYSLAASSPHCERRHLCNFAPRAQRMDRGRHRLLPGLKDFLLRILQVKFPNVRMRLLRYTFLSTISRSRLTASIFDNISHIIC